MRNRQTSGESASLDEGTESAEVATSGMMRYNRSCLMLYKCPTIL